MTVTALPLNLDARLEKWSKYSDQWLGKSIAADTWQQAAHWFFELFTRDDVMFPIHNEWEVLDVENQIGQHLKCKEIRGLAWKFFEREPGKYGVRLVGTVEVAK